MNPQPVETTTVPGDPDEVRRIAAQFTAVERRAQEIQTRLRSIETGVGPQSWRGSAATSFTTLLAETGPDLTTLATSYASAAQALTTYATQLAAAQDTARAARTEATTAVEARNRAAADRDSARADVDRHTTAARSQLDPAAAQQAEQQRTDALSRETTAAAAADQAEQSLQAARQKSDQAANERNAAAARCVRELDAARRAGIEIRNLTQDPAAADGIAQATAAESTRPGDVGTGVAAQAATAGIAAGTVAGAAVTGAGNGAGATLAGAAHGVLGAAATSLVRSFALPVPGPVVLPPPPANAAAALNAAWWKGLDAAQRQQVLQAHPDWVGNRDGIPAAARDRANRSRLAEETARVDRELAATTARLQASLDRFVRGGPEIRRRTELRAEIERLNEQRNVLTTIAATLVEGRQLLAFDVSEPGSPRAAVAVGDVDTADHVAVFTPGFTTTVGESLEGYVNDMQAIQDVARQQLSDAGRDESVAAVAWLDYDAPQWDTMVEGDQTVATDAAARLGGARLAGFLDGIVAARPDDPHLTALGHSYGSTTTGYALQEASGVDDAVLFGSPGASTGDTADLRVPPGHVAVMEARGDWVADLGVYGGDPNRLDGVTNLSTHAETAPDGAPLTESEGHSQYLVPGTTSQHNVAVTVAGLPDLRVTGTNTGFGDIVRNPPLPWLGTG